MSMTVKQAQQLVDALTPPDAGQDRDTYQAELAYAHELAKRVTLTRVALEYIAAGGDPETHLGVLREDIADLWPHNRSSASERMPCRNDGTYRT